MSAFFNQWYLTPRYFHMKYLHGPTESTAKSGWWRLMLSNMQEDALKDDTDKKEQEPVRLTSVIIPNDEVKNKTKAKIAQSKISSISPEEEIAKDIVSTLPKLIYRNKKQIYNPPQFGAINVGAIISDLWVRLGVNIDPFDMKIEEDDESVESDEDFILLASLL